MKSVFNKLNQEELKCLGLMTKNELDQLVNDEKNNKDEITLAQENHLCREILKKIKLSNDERDIFKNMCNAKSETDLDKIYDKNASTMVNDGILFNTYLILKCEGFKAIHSYDDSFYDKLVTINDCLDVINRDDCEYNLFSDGWLESVSPFTSFTDMYNVYHNNYFEYSIEDIQQNYPRIKDLITTSYAKDLDDIKKMFGLNDCDIEVLKAACYYYTHGKYGSFLQRDKIRMIENIMSKNKVIYCMDKFFKKGTFISVNMDVTVKCLKEAFKIIAIEEYIANKKGRNYKPDYDKIAVAARNSFLKHPSRKEENIRIHNMFTFIEKEQNNNIEKE